MASYKYRQLCLDSNDKPSATAGYIDYNITPDYGVPICPGETVTIEGQIYCKQINITTIEFFYYTRDSDPVLLPSIASKTVNAAKAKLTPFAITFTVNERMYAGEGRSRLAGADCEFFGTSESGGIMNSAVYQASTAGVQRMSYALYRIDPMIVKSTVSDDHERDPFGHFGAYVQNRSIPRLAFEAELDPIDPTLTAVHALKLILPDESQQVLTSEDGIFRMDSFARTGSYSWTYTVTDSVGNSASESGSFDVLAYSPPRFDALSIHRYTQSVDDEGNPVYTATDDGDRIWFTIDASVASLNGLNAWKLVRLRDDTQNEIDLLAGEDGERVLCVDDHTLDTSIYSPTSTIGVTLILSDFFETLERYEVILKAGGYLHVTKAGTAVGMRSTATPQQKKFEVAEDCEARFYGAAIAGSGGGVSLYYKPGDTIEFINLTLKTAGYITSSRTQVCFAVPLNKPLDPSITGAVCSDGKLTLRQSGSYVYGASGDMKAPSSISIDINPSASALSLNCTTPTMSGSTNNASTGVQFLGTIAFV